MSRLAGDDGSEDLIQRVVSQQQASAVQQADLNRQLMDRFVAMEMRFVSMEARFDSMEARHEASIAAAGQIAGAHQECTDRNGAAADKLDDITRRIAKK
jgi:hypothetical protein